MEKSKKVAIQAQSVAFFIHRSRIQKLYRNFLRVCESKVERQQVREEFKNNRMTKSANLKEAEAILKRLQLACGIKPTTTAFTAKTAPLLTNHSSSSSLGGRKALEHITNSHTALEGATLSSSDGEGEPAKVEWP